MSLVMGSAGALHVVFDARPAMNGRDVIPDAMWVRTLVGSNWSIEAVPAMLAAFPGVDPMLVPGSVAVYGSGRLRIFALADLGGLFELSKPEGGSWTSAMRTPFARYHLAAAADPHGRPHVAFGQPIFANAVSDGAGVMRQAEGPPVVRFAGATRYDTAAAVATGLFGPTVPSAFFATGLNFPDALAAAPVAAFAGGPLLLTRQFDVPPGTSAAINALAPLRGYIVGGTGAIATFISSINHVERLWGNTRYETAKVLFGFQQSHTQPTLVIASGQAFPDALAAASAASYLHGNLVLLDSRGSSLPYIVEPESVFVVGGAAVVPDFNVDRFRSAPFGFRRVWGADRYATAAALSAAVFPADIHRVYIATGENFPDALAGATAASRDAAPLLLVRRDLIPAATAAELVRLKPRQIVILGGTGVVSASVATQLAAFVQP
jgi:putative cell wall-binding protein